MPTKKSLETKGKYVVYSMHKDKFFCMSFKDSTSVIVPQCGLLLNTFSGVYYPTGFSFFPLCQLKNLTNCK